MFDKLWDFVRNAVLTWFGPPDVDNEQALLKWVQESLAWLTWIAKRTATQIDDQIVAGLKTITDDPAKWAVVYSLVVKLFGDGIIDDRVGDPADVLAQHHADVAKVAEQVGIPIGVLVQIILLLLKLFRQSR